MDNFFTDIRNQVLSYYEFLVELFPKLILALTVLILFWVIAIRARSFARKRLLGSIEDPLLANFIARIIKFAFILIGILGFLQIIGLGKAASSLLAGAGISAFIIGFAFKDIGENFLAGILMAFQRPFRIGDIVETGTTMGKIVGLSFRETHIKTFDGKDVFVPNGMILKNPIINYTIDGFLRQDFVVGLDYEADLHEAMNIILEQLRGVEGILQEDKAPFIFITDLNSNTVDLTVYYWFNTDSGVSSIQIKNMAIRMVLNALQEAGFHLPRTVVEIKNG
jgi:small conductance mechanosensitive channel